jgi:hypothetical protein
MGLLLLTACGDCQDEIDAAGRFLQQPENLACQTDQDCRVVPTTCHTFPGGACSQAHLNVQAASSAEWKKLSDALDSCQSDDCINCASLLEPNCLEGVCRSL